MCRGELLSLRWQNLDFARRLIYVTNTKTGHDREIPMNAKVREALSDLQQVNGAYEFVFTNPKHLLHRTE
jgi:integrase